ncbi:zonular occludens toxin domain-containing protein [Pseudoalteromonas sp. APC 3691]|uniref:zonular occludens toxin domain-containing protein n=1 Tax=Pseudoalteromonas sp. APC 3691 TaxID=3035173 RepID=UPI0025B5919F|nr:zonular occludens toxin domain-containing protein [Pseudoalteromonas sp. APC 3691]MDN3393301.1 zonular occludens toxin domain-containing protein [Pseudoalteromonas sp. APC 3691]
MINGIQGKPGGGKSYEAVVNHIIPTVTQDKRKVVTNLPLNVDKFCEVYGEFCRDLIEIVDGEFHNYGGKRPFSTKDFFLKYQDWQNEKGQKVYFFVDECHLAMPSTGTEKELTEFFSMHRHYGFDIMLITQNFRKVNRDIKDMIQLTYRCIKKAHMGQNHLYILKVHDGVGTSPSTVFSTNEREYDKKYFPFYTSHTKNSESVEEATTKDIKKWYNHWSIWGAAITIPIGLFVMIGALSGGESLEEKAKNIKDTQSSQPVQPSTVPQNKVPVNVSQSELPVVQVSSLSKEKPKPKDSESESEKQSHPFYKVALHIAGWAEYTDRGKILKNYYLSASQNGQHIFDISLRDLALSGYSVIVRSGCMIEISYKSYHDFITCDAPTVEVFQEDNDLSE